MLTKQHLIIDPKWIVEVLGVEEVPVEGIPVTAVVFSRPTRVGNLARIMENLNVSLKAFPAGILELEGEPRQVDRAREAIFKLAGDAADLTTWARVDPAERDWLGEFDQELAQARGGSYTTPHPDQTAPRPNQLVGSLARLTGDDDFEVDDLETDLIQRQRVAEELGYDEHDQRRFSSQQGIAPPDRFVSDEAHPGPLIDDWP